MDASSEHESTATASSSTGAPFHDARGASGDVVHLLLPARSDLRDGTAKPRRVLDEIRDDVEESLHHVKEFRHDREESLDDVKKSVHDRKKSSQRRFQLESVGSELGAVMERLLHHRPEDEAHVEGKLASRFPLESVGSRLGADGSGRKSVVV